MQSRRSTHSAAIALLMLSLLLVCFYGLGTRNGDEDDLLQRCRFYGQSHHAQHYERPLPFEETYRRASVGSDEAGDTDTAFIELGEGELGASYENDELLLDPSDNGDKTSGEENVLEVKEVRQDQNVENVMPWEAPSEVFGSAVNDDVFGNEEDGELDADSPVSEQ